MADNRFVAGGQQRRLLPSQGAACLVSDEIHAAVLAVKQSLPRPPVDGVVLKARPDQLNAADRAALSGRDSSDYVRHGVVLSPRATFSALNAGFVARDEGEPPCATFSGFVVR